LKDPVARPVVDPQLRDAFTHGLHIPRVAHGETFDARLHPRPPFQVAQAVEPLGEDLGLADFDHQKTVATRLHRVNAAPGGARLTPMTLERAIEFITEGEAVEVTPKSVRLRKRVLRVQGR